MSAAPSGIRPLVRQMRDQGLKTVLMAGERWLTRSSLDHRTAAKALCSPSVRPRNKPTAKAIVDRFKAKNIDPEATRFIPTPRCRCGRRRWRRPARRPEEVMETIKAGAWDTVLGKMEFDAKGDIKQLDYVVYKWTPRATTSDQSKVPKPLTAQ